MPKVFEIKVEYQKVSGRIEIRRLYCLLGVCVLKTYWFSLSKIWPGLMATTQELNDLGCTEVREDG